MEKQIRDYMTQQISNHIDPITNEANITAMAEDAINEFAGNNWEDWHEDGHPVWDIAVDVSEDTGFGIHI